jgi:hypothetical protein
MRAQHQDALDISRPTRTGDERQQARHRIAMTGLREGERLPQVGDDLTDVRLDDMDVRQDGKGETA